MAEGCQRGVLNPNPKTGCRGRRLCGVNKASWQFLDKSSNLDVNNKIIKSSNLDEIIEFVCVQKGARNGSSPEALV